MVSARLRPVFGVPVGSLAEHGKIVQHGETVWVDLSLSLETLWQQTRTGHRYDIRKGRRESLLPEIDSGWREFGSFCGIYEETMRRVGADPLYFFRALTSPD